MHFFAPCDEITQVPQLDAQFIGPRFHPIRSDTHTHTQFNRVSTTNRYCTPYTHTLCLMGFNSRDSLAEPAASCTGATTSTNNTTISRNLEAPRRRPRRSIHALARISTDIMNRLGCCRCCSDRNQIPDARADVATVAGQDVQHGCSALLHSTAVGCFLCVRLSDPRNAPRTTYRDFRVVRLEWGVWVATTTESMTIISRAGYIRHTFHVI